MAKDRGIWVQLKKQRKVWVAKNSRSGQQWKVAKIAGSEKNRQRNSAKEKGSEKQRNSAKKTGSEKQRNSAKKGQRKTAKFSEKKQAAEFLKIPTRTTIICVVPHLRPTHRCRLGCRAHLTAGKSVEIMRTDYTVLSVCCSKCSYMNEHEPIKNQTWKKTGHLRG